MSLHTREEISSAEKILKELQQDDELCYMDFSINETGGVKIRCLDSVAFTDVKDEIFKTITSTSKRVDNVLEKLDLD